MIEISLIYLLRYNFKRNIYEYMSILIRNYKKNLILYIYIKVKAQAGKKSKGIVKIYREEIELFIKKVRFA